MHDCAHWPQAFLGCLYAGVVPVAVNTMLPAGDYAYMLQHSRAQAALVSAALLPTLQSALASAPHEVKTLVVSRGDAGALPPGAHDFDALLGAHAPAAEPAPTCADDLAFWLYSSGSTGRPKGTVHSHANLYCDRRAVRAAGARRCARTTSASRRPSCSSPTASATR